MLKVVEFVWGFLAWGLLVNVILFLIGFWVFVHPMVMDFVAFSQCQDMYGEGCHRELFF